MFLQRLSLLSPAIIRLPDLIRGVREILAVLEFNAAQIGSVQPTFRDDLYVTNYQSTLF